MSRCLRCHGACGGPTRRHDETTTRRKPGSYESLRRTAPAGAAALRAVAGVRSGRSQAAQRRNGCLCSTRPHSCNAGPEGRRAVGGEPLILAPVLFRRVVASSCRSSLPAAGAVDSEDSVAVAVARRGSSRIASHHHDSVPVECSLPGRAVRLRTRGVAPAWELLRILRARSGTGSANPVASGFSRKAA